MIDTQNIAILQRKIYVNKLLILKKEVTFLKRKIKIITI